MNRLIPLLLLAAWPGWNAPAFAADMQALSLKTAQDLAIKNHPRITAAELLALASKETVTQARSAFFPALTAEATAVDATAVNTRIAAGALNNPLILSRNSEGVNVSQLITDFGRTANLTSGAKLRSQAEAANALATRAEILLEVDSAYFNALQAQAVLAVAKQTVATRQDVLDRVSALATNRLRAEMDVTFARVDLQSGQLLRMDAENDVQSAFAKLSNLLGEREQRDYALAQEPVPVGAPPDGAQLVATALHDRPDVLRLRYESQAASKFASAEKDLHYPTISAVAAAGVLTDHDPALRDNYAAAGVNLSLPIFDGFLFTAREKEAQLRAQAAAEDLRNLENNVIRDVRIAALNFNYAAQRLTVTAQLLASANESFELAKARLDVGSSSIVELSQAQLSQTEAEIAQARAKYELQIQNAVLNFQTGALR